MKTENLNTEQLYRFLEESFVNRTKNASTSKLKERMAKSAFSMKTQICFMLENIYEICEKHGYESRDNGMSLSGKNGPEKVSFFVIPSFDDSGFSEGILNCHTCIASNEKIDIGFQWNVAGRGIYKYPNNRILDSSKDKDEIHFYTVYGYDDTILLDKRTSKSHGRMKETYNVQIFSLNYSYKDDCLKIGWTTGCQAYKNIGYDTSSKNIDFDKCPKSLQKKIFNSIQKKYNQILTNG